MKCNLILVKMVLDNIIFNDANVKALVAKGLIKPESKIKTYPDKPGKVSINYTYCFFESSLWLDAESTNEDDSEYLFGYDLDKSWLKKVSHRILSELRKADVGYEREYNHALDEIYSAPYLSNRYNGD